MTRLLPVALLLAACIAPDATWDPDGPRWAQGRMPLAVTSVDIDQADAEAAVEFWPSCVVHYEGEGEAGDIVIRIGADEREDLAGSWQLRLHGGRWTGEALVRQPGDRRVVTLAAAHELGHLLGLAHDRSKASIMHWAAAGRAGYVTATESDNDALLARYCR